MAVLIVLLLLVATNVRAQVVAAVGPNVAVAHDGRVELFDTKLDRIWNGEGVANASRIVTSPDRIAIIDSFENRVRIIDVASGQGQTFPTLETPLDGVFRGGDLYLLDRDSGDGALENVEKHFLVQFGDDCAYLRSANDLLYVYCRGNGLVLEIAPPGRITRKVTIAPFASDFEADGTTGYLVYPQEAKLRTFSLRTMTRTSDVAAGVVPVDLAVTSRASALSATRLAVADPSAKRVWVVEGSESIARAVTRGFLRGLLGLGLFSPASSQFPTGVDRVMARGSTTLAYDSTTRTLYRVRGSRGTAVAHDVPPAGFTIADNGIIVWQNGVLRLIR